MAFQTPQDIFVSAVPKEAGGPGTPGTWQISTGGGAHPVWRGKEIVYVAPGGKLMAVPVETGDGVRAGAPVALFDTPMDGGGFARSRQYDVAPDGKHILMSEAVITGPESPISVVAHWEKLLP